MTLHFFRSVITWILEHMAIENRDEEMISFNLRPFRSLRMICVLLFLFRANLNYIFNTLSDMADCSQRGYLLHKLHRTFSKFYH